MFRVPSKQLFAAIDALVQRYRLAESRNLNGQAPKELKEGARGHQIASEAERAYQICDLFETRWRLMSERWRFFLSVQGRS